MTRVLVEVCLDSVESAMAAAAAGAARVELCDNLVEGGTTPSAGMIGLCAERVGIPVFVMIRPRGGDFLYSDVELEVMRRDIAEAKRLGAAGVVFGLLRRDGTVDAERTRSLVDEARPLAVTFHRAFDVCRDPVAALELLIELGVERVLTSGQQVTAEAGFPLLRQLVRQAGGRIGILAAGEIRTANVQRLIAQTGVREIHLRGAMLEPSPMEHRNPRIEFGGQPAPPDNVRVVTDAALIRSIAQAADFRLEGHEGQAASTPLSR